MQRSFLLFGGQNLFNSYCTRTILKNRMNSSFSSNHPGAIHPILQIVLVQNSQRTAQQGIEYWYRNIIFLHSVPQTAATTFAFSSVLILLLAAQRLQFWILGGSESALTTTWIKFKSKQCQKYPVNLHITLPVTIPVLLKIGFKKNKVPINQSTVL